MIISESGIILKLLEMFNSDRREGIVLEREMCDCNCEVFNKNGSRGDP